MNRFFYISAIVVFTALVTIIALLYLTLQRSPTTQALATPTQQDYAQFLATTNRLTQTTTTNQERISLQLTLAELESVFRVAQAQVNNPRIGLNLELEQAELKLSHPLSDNWWINLRIQKKDELGMLPSEIWLGRIKLPHIVTQKVSTFLIQRYTGNSIAELKLDQGEAKITTQKLELTLDTRIFSVIKINRLLTDFSSSSSFKPSLNPTWIKYYRTAFTKFFAAGSSNSSFSLSSYLRLIDNIEPASPTLSRNHHIEYSLLALSSLTGAPYYNTLLPIAQNNNEEIPFTLGARRDLAKHFLISAGLRIISNRRTSISVGLAKEILDSKPGGSGFSYIDLTADQAGIAFAELILSAKPIQLKNINENDFFPSRHNLQEELSIERLEQAHISQENKHYEDVVKKIEKLIASTPLYDSGRH